MVKDRKPKHSKCIPLNKIKKIIYKYFKVAEESQKLQPFKVEVYKEVIFFKRGELQ